VQVDSLGYGNPDCFIPQIGSIVACLGEVKAQIRPRGTPKRMVRSLSTGHNQEK